MLGISECMLLTQSMPRVPYARNLWVHALNSEHAQNALCLTLDAHWLVMPISVYLCTHPRIGYFKARGVMKDTILDMIKIELTNIPVKSGIVFLM